MPHPPELTVIDLRNPPLPADQLARLLSPDEQERAALFRFPALRGRFQVGRGMLRYLLGEACNMPPERLCFTYSAHGKPSLPGIHFNASHSGDLWACAIHRELPLGLDIEQVRPMADHHAIARRFFAPVEYEAIARYPKEASLAAFFRCWTRKEAYIKALGDGLSRGLATFTVSCGAEQVSSVDDSSCPNTWQIESFVPAPGYMGALATR